MKNKLSVLGVLLLAVVVTAYSVSGTYAKYTSEKSASDSARVAKWSFKVGEGENAKDIAKEDFTFSLFDTINDTTDGNDETDVNDGLIAPGTKGSFLIKLTNASEVTAQYKIDFTSTNSGIPIEYSLVGTDEATDWTTDLSTLSIAESDATKLRSNGEDSKTVYWRWAFVGTNSKNYKTTQTEETDTALGVADTAAEASVTAKITATQVD